MKRHTLHKPARYLPGTTAGQIRELETATVRHGQSETLRPGHTEYHRKTDVVIGWDEGMDAKYSFTECSGGLVAGRAFHGRPMAAPNHKLEER